MQPGTLIERLHSNRKWLHLILVQYAKAVFLIIFQIDPPLPIVISAGVTPYGILWYLINWPIAFFLNIHLWQVWLLSIDTIISIILFRKTKLRVYIPFQAMSLLDFEQGLANVSVLWTSALGFISPWFIIISICTKLPVGWSWPWDLTNPHVDYAIHGHVNDANHIRTYTYIVTWWAYPTIWWLKKWI